MAARLAAAFAVSLRSEGPALTRTVAEQLHLASNALVQAVRDGQSAVVERDTAWMLVLATAASALVLGYPMSRLTSTSSESRVVASLLLVYGALLVVWSAHFTSYMVLFHVVSSVGAVLTTSFVWALASEDHLAYFNWFSLAASAGQGLGSALAWALLDWHSSAHAGWLLIAAGGCTMAAAACVLDATMSSPRGAQPIQNLKGDAKKVQWDFDFVGMVALYSLWYGAVTSLTLLARSDALNAAGYTLERASSVTSRVSAAAAVVCVAVQLADPHLPPLLALLSLPVLTALMLLIANMLPWDAVSAEIATSFLLRVASFATSKPAREALYGAMSRGEKYTSKPLIDSVVNRFGQATGAVLHAFLAGRPSNRRVLVHMALSALWVVLTMRLTRRFDEKMKRYETLVKVE